MKFRPIFVVVMLLSCALTLLPAGRSYGAQAPFGSVFSYQGQLRSSGNPLTADCDFQFKLYDAGQAGNQVGLTRVLNKIQVRNGLFNVELDFGPSAFTAIRWLEISVAYPAGSGNFTMLTPRQKITPTPLALAAASVANYSITSSSLAGSAVTSSKIANGAVHDSHITSLQWAKITGAPQSMPPSGTAGGALAGLYPYPSLAVGAVKTSAIATGAVTSASLANGAVTTGKLANASVTDAKIASLQWAKITGAPATLPPSGSAGGALAGSYPNPILAAGSVKTSAIAPAAITTTLLADGSVTSTTLADSAVTSRALAAGAVIPRTLADNAVTSAAIAPGAVTNEKILSVDWLKITGSPLTLPPTGAAGGDLTGTYPAPVIADGAVTTPKIGDQAVTTPKLANGSVISTTLADNAVTSRALADGAVADQKIESLSYAKITGAPATLPPTGAAGGALSGVYPNPALADAAVTSRALADQSILTAKLADGAVTSRGIAAQAVTNEKILSVDWNKITSAPATLPPSGPAGGALRGSFPNPLLASGAVGTSELADAAVTTAKLADGAVTDQKIEGLSYSKLTGAPLTLPPSGHAGGVLTGSYPNPALVESGVTSAALAARSVIPGKLADSAVTSRTIAAEAVTNDKILSVDWLKITGSPAALPPSGAAGGALAGVYPNPVLAANAVNTAALIDGSVTTTKLATEAVTNEKILSVDWLKITGTPAALPPSGAAGGALAGTYPKPSLAANAVNTDALSDGSIITAKLADGAVTDQKIDGVAYAKITGAPLALPPTGAAGGALTGLYPKPTLADAVVTSRTIADQSILTAKLADAAVTSRTIAAEAVTNEKILSVDWVKITGTPTALPPTGAAGGALAGAYPNPVLAANAVNTDSISNGAVTTAKLADGAVTDEKIASLSYVKLNGTPATLPPTGAAGGALAGSYPNPTLADNAVTNPAIADSAVTSRTLADQSILTAKLADNSVTSRTLAAAAVTNEKILSVDWLKITGSPVTLPPSGVAGGALAGTYPNPVLAANAVNADALSDGSVITAKLADGAVTDQKIEGLSFAKITGAPVTLPPTGAAGGALAGSYPNPTLADNAVTNPAIADNAVTSRTLADQSILTAKLADNAVTSRTIAAEAITNEKILSVDWLKITGSPATLPPSGSAGGALAGTYPNPVLAANAVSTDAIGDGSITTAKLANGAVTNQKIEGLAYGKITGAPTALPPTGAAGGDLTGIYPAPVIAPGAVTNSKLADCAVSSRTLAAAAVTNEKISTVAWTKITGAPLSFPPTGAAGGDLTGSFPAPVIADGAVSTAKLAAGAVTTVKLDNGAVTTLKLADGAVANSKLDNDAISSSKLMDGAVTTAKLADDAVTNDKIERVAYEKITGAPTALPPTGAAGGALAGFYPNPALAAGSVNTSIISNGAVTDGKIATVSWSKITGAPSSMPPSGSAGGDLNGSYPNPTIAGSAITASKLASAAVTAAKLATGAVGTGALADGAVTDSKIVSVSWSKILGAPLSFLPLTLSCNTSNTTDAVLKINDLGQGRAIDAVTSSSHSAVRGESKGINGWGLYGIASIGELATGVGGESVLGSGITGRNMNTSNYGSLGTMNEGAYGQALRTNAHGVTGVADTGTSASAVFGTSAAGRGVLGVNSVSGNNGVLGSPTFGAFGSSVRGIGVYALTTSGTALYAKAGTKGAAAVFDGDVTINGVLNTNGGKHFKIDHPLDPAGKYLIHASIEGPERMNLYSGNVVTDAQGLAVVKMPDYFEALNTDFRYQLTPIGQFAQAIIFEKIQNNRFTIRTDKPGVEISWQVIGNRKDAYALAHPFTVEEAKTDSDRAGQPAPAPRNAR